MEDRLKAYMAGKQVRLGFTTGSCAAAAAKAAANLLVTGTKMNTVEIDTPSGIRLHLNIEKLEKKENTAFCSILKDGGDDPDVTTGIEICAEAEFSNQEGISILGGEGVGRVTKKGLKIEPGYSAINPEPLRMIKKEVAEIIENGIKITISVPQGQEIAKKTFNPRLGIEGGISIIGTSGIVTPMSEEAWKDSIFLELKMKKELGIKNICYVFGNYGEKFAKQVCQIDSEKILSISNFVGYFLECASNLGFCSVLLVGHMGKLVKVAAGNFHTHSKISDARMETLCAFAALSGGQRNILEQIYSCVTTEAAEEILKQNGLCSVFQKVAEQSESKCRMRIYDSLELGTILFGKDNQTLAYSKSAPQILEQLRTEKIEK